MAIIIVENVSRGELELFIPYCPLCRTPMLRKEGHMLMPPKENMLQIKDKKVIKIKNSANVLPKYILKNIAPGQDGTQLSIGTIGNFVMACPYHPDQIESLTPEQLAVVNKYPIGKQVFRKVPLTKRVK